MKGEKKEEEEEMNLIGFAYSSKKRREQSMTFMCVEKYKRKSKGYVMTHIIKKNMNPT